MKPWQDVTIPPELAAVRSMLAREEVQYLAWLTEKRFEGWGAIVDLGPWLGGSSAALAEGLKRKNRRDKVVSFDLFQWEPTYMEAVADEKLAEGDDFLPVFNREIASYAPWIDGRKQDLLNYRWNGGPIEILFVDAAKSWDLTNAILDGFKADLVPGRSRVVLQDFRHHTTHWLPLIIDSRPDLWEETESVDDGWTVTFTPKASLNGPHGIHESYTEKTFSYETAAHLLRNRIRREGPKGAHLLLRTLYRVALASGPAEDVASLRAEVLQGPCNAAELAEIEDIAYILVPRGWDAYVHQDFETARTMALRSLAIASTRSPHILSLLGMALLRLGDVKGAKGCIDEVVASNASIPFARLQRAEVAIADGRPDVARRDAIDTLEAANPTEELIGYALGVLAEVEKAAPQQMLRSLLEVAPRFSDSPAFLAHMAHAYFRSDKYDEGNRLLERALQIAPGNEVAQRIRNDWPVRLKADG